MRILFFSDHFKPEPSAPAAHVYERAKLWVQWGHEVTIITSAPNFPTGQVYPGYRNRWRTIEDMDGIRVVRVKTFITANEGFLLRIFDYMSYMLSAFCQSFRELKPDIVISTSPHLFTAVTGVAYSNSRRVPHVFEVRDLWPASILATGAMKPGFIYRLLERIELNLYSRSERIISLTHSFVDDLTKRGVPGDKIDVVINGANLELFSPRPRDEEIESRYNLKNRFVVGYLGTIGLASGLENVVRAAVLLQDTPVTFFIVGAGAALQELEKQVRDRKLDNVVFAGRQLKEDMPRFWSVCDASLIHLRNSEVFTTVIPSKIFESMAMRKPIIYAAPTGEGSDIVESHNAGIVVQPEDPQALAGGVCLMADNFEQRTRFADNSLLAAPLYSREIQAKKSLEVLQKALRQDVVIKVKRKETRHDS